MTLRRLLLDPPEQKTWAGFRYGFLALICALLVWNVYIFVRFSPSYHGDRYANLILVVMLLLNHVSAYFHLPPRITVVVRVLAIGWLAFGLVWVCYLSRIFFPLR